MTIWTTVALDLVGFGIVVPILGRYAERFGATGLQVGLLFASFSLAQLVFAPILGRLSDRVGRKPVIMLSLLGTAIGSFVTGAAGDERADRRAEERQHDHRLATNSIGQTTEDRCEHELRE